jgi:hypothetical protein
MKGERRAERQRRAEIRRLGAEAGRRRGCLICRRGDGGFSAEEHIIPETLGNTTLVLPVGVVCDRCNHGVCAELDEALCSFGPIHMLRTIHRQPSKSGKLPSMGFDNGRIEARSSDEISLWLSGEKWHREHPAPPGYKSFSFTAKRRDLTPERLSRVHRALVKQALEFAWLDHGEDLVLDAEFDHARRIVLGGGHQGYISVPRNIQFGDDERSGMDYARLTRNEGGPSTAVHRRAVLGRAADHRFALPRASPDRSECFRRLDVLIRSRSRRSLRHMAEPGELNFVPLTTARGRGEPLVAPVWLRAAAPPGR